MPGVGQFQVTYRIVCSVTCDLLKTEILLVTNKAHLSGISGISLKDLVIPGRLA